MLLGIQAKFEMQINQQKNLRVKFKKEKLHLLEDTIFCMTPLHDADDNPRLITQMMNLFLRQIP